MDGETLLLEIECDADRAEILAAELGDFDPLGIDETDPVTDARRTTLRIYFAENAEESEIEAALAAARAGTSAGDRPSGPISWRFSRVPPFDWVSEVRRTYQPIPISNRLVVAPSWEKTQYGPDVTVIRIDPGQAFGTGRHESTQLCLELMADAFDGGALPAGPRVLDVGCGTGVLAIFAALSGASHVTSIDVDPLAVDVTKGNLACNNVRCETAVLCATPAEIDGCFDLVLANIRHRTLLDGARVFRRTVADGGRIVLSGLLHAEAEEVAEAYANLGMVETGRRSAAEWTAVMMEATR